MSEATGSKRPPSRPYRMRRRAEGVERTRRAILEAVLEIGDPRELTIARAAERAGVSSRTVLRQFGSRRGLIEAAISYGGAVVEEERFEIEPGDVEGAVANLIAHYELRGDEVIWRLAEGHASEEVELVNESGRELHRRWVDHAFGPQLDRLDGATRRRRHAALVAACDVYTWKILRRDMGLGVGQTERAVAELARGITEPEGGAR